MQHIQWADSNEHNEHIHYLSAGRWQHHCWHQTNWRRWRCARGCQSERSSDQDSVNRCTAEHQRPPSPADSAADSTTETAGSALNTHIKQQRSHIQSVTTSMAIILTPITRHRASTSARWRFTFALWCHSNETSALIANLPNSAQLEDTLYHSPKLHPGPCSSVKMQQGIDTDTHTHTHTDSHDNYTFRVVHESCEM